MGLKSKVSVLICLLLISSICIYSVQFSSVHAWGWSTHQFIASSAIELMPDDLDWFFSTYSSVIIEYSVKPDEWKGSDPYEQYRHWYHVDHPHGEDQYWEGVLPWALEDNFNMFVQYLRENDWSRAAQLAGVISHYMSDATMPLHATSDYNPGGKHTAYESTVNGHLGEINMSMPGFVPQEVGDVFNSTMQLLNESYGYTGYTPDKLNYWLAQGILWNAAIKGITENRLRSAAQFHANIWYTGMVQAGLVFPPLHLVAGWNLVGFTGVSGNDNLGNIFRGLTYYENYYLYYWKPPYGGYGMDLGPDNVPEDNLGYWVWIDQDTTVGTSGTPPENRDIHLVAGWNLVSFPVVDKNTTIGKVFTDLEYYTNYYLYYWNPPSGPYGVDLGPGSLLEDNLGYWVFIDQNKTVTVP